jgi:hypothetical protein
MKNEYYTDTENFLDEYMLKIMIVLVFLWTIFILTDHIYNPSTSPSMLEVHLRFKFSSKPNDQSTNRINQQ